MGKWRHLPTGMTHTMAVNTTQNPAAAADTTTDGAPSVAGPTASPSNQQQLSELSLADALRLDLADPEEDKQDNDGADGNGDDDDSNDGDDDQNDNDGDDSDERDDDNQGDDDDDSDEGDDDDSDDDDSDDDSKDDKSKDKKEGDKDGDTPKGLEDLPKWAQKRIQKQSNDIRTLKGQIAEGGITLTPTALTPLAHVKDQETLTKEIQMAKNVRNLLGKIKDEDFQDGPNGPQVEVQVGQQKFVLSKEDVASKLAHADTVLDPEVLTSRQDFLRHREQYKPWEAAEQVMPGILQKDTPANKAYNHLLKSCPEIAARLPDFEFIMACAVRGLSQYKEESEGKAKWQRFALDDKGNIVPPKRKADDKDKGKGGKKGKPAPAAPAAPANQRPAVRPAGAKATNADLDDLQKRAEAGDEGARRELMKLEMLS